AVGAFRRVGAGLGVGGRKWPAVRLRARHDVVSVRRVAAPVHRLALLVERRLLADLVAGAVEVVDVLRDHLALGVLPRALPNPVARVDGRRAAGGLGAEIRVPRVAAGTTGL